MWMDMQETSMIKKVRNDLMNITIMLPVLGDPIYDHDLVMWQWGRWERANHVYASHSHNNSTGSTRPE